VTKIYRRDDHIARTNYQFTVSVELLRLGDMRFFLEKMSPYS